MHQLTAYRIAEAEDADRWVPANGGTETPFTFQRRVYLYVYNHATGQHGWLGPGDIVYRDFRTGEML